MPTTIGGISISVNPDAQELQSKYPDLSDDEACLLSKDTSTLTDQERKQVDSVLSKINEIKYSQNHSH